MTDPYLILELTTSCNLDCIYCYNVWKEKDNPSEKELKLSLLEKIIPAILNDTSISGITLTGGEPMLNEEIFDIVSFLSSRCKNVNITSNGIFMTEENVRRLISLGIKHFEISMPASNATIFRTLCGSGNMKAVRSAMLNIKKHSAKFSVASTVCRMNYTSVPEIIQLSAAFGAEYFIFNRFVPGGRGKSMSHELMMDREQLMHSLSLADRAAAENRIPVVIALPVEHCIYDTENFKNLRWGTCGCGYAKWVIDPEGNLRTCEQNPEILGNLLQENFTSPVMKTQAEVFRNNNLKSGCMKKKCFPVCGGGCRFCR